MGVGKTVVGRAVAERLSVAFADLDAHIGSPAEIFALEGEAGFRARERAALASLVEGHGVISLGGGTLAFAANRAALADWQVLVLMARPDALRIRLGEGGNRPLAHRWESLLEERLPIFRLYAPFVETDELTPANVVEAVLGRAT